MLAKRLPTILPPLSLHEALETTKIHSVADLALCDDIRIEHLAAAIRYRNLDREGGAG